MEEADCTPEQKAIRELNVGAYLFRADWLWAGLSQVPLSAKGEYYLTDCADLLRRGGKTVLAACCFEIAEALGVNTPEQLAEVERVMRRAT